MKLRRSRTAEIEVPDGYTGLTRVPAADPVAAFHAVQEGVGRPVLLFVAPHVGDFEAFRRTLAHLPQGLGVATVYDAGRTRAGHPYVVTAAPGGSLGDRLSGGPLSPAAAVALTVRLAEALSTAHAMGIVHGDIRPEYVWLADETTPALTGFGLWSPAAPPLSWAPVTCVHLAPEVLEGAEPEAAADVYALTSVLATALNGEPPHLAASWAGHAALIQRKLEPPPTAGIRPDVPEALLAVVRRGLAASPATRYASAAELAAALHAAGTAEPVETVRREATATFAPPDLAAPLVTEQHRLPPDPAVPGTVPAAGPETVPARHGGSSPLPLSSAGNPGWKTRGEAVDNSADTTAAGQGAGPLGDGPLLSGSGEETPAVTPRDAAGPHGPLIGMVPDLEVGTAGTGGRRVLVVAAAALAIVALAGVLGVLGKGRSRPAAARRPAPTPSAPTASSHPAPTATRQAPVLSKLELTRYQPAKLKAVPAPQQAVLTWTLPPDARRDGAGIIIRRQPADDTPVVALSRTNGRLPETYVAVPLSAGRQYCFLVGVLLRRADGGTELAQSGPVCAMPR
ncbi:serine/threonine-protein kinase [Actinoallomurus iriomotensis]|uniref:non-specific serine/threonine protein kinase n=1 Tax=Actinoallomurus iriomotensis TaxID=478107 RepID=A0A9W6S3L6_9ACTN|nr:hypothetical protein [Actinoallomurus iriomotensis]GLY86611.1 hypothetical protein Airi02_045400 [Actinoallomurus iriomotensis]